MMCSKHYMECLIRYTVELQWLEHLWGNRKLFETWVVRATAPQNGGILIIYYVLKKSDNLIRCKLEQILIGSHVPPAGCKMCRHEACSRTPAS